VCRILSLDYPKNIGSESRLRSKGTLIPNISFESHVMRITKDKIQLLIMIFTTDGTLFSSGFLRMVRVLRLSREFNRLYTDVMFAVHLDWTMTAIPMIGFLDTAWSIPSLNTVVRRRHRFSFNSALTTYEY
jgi:hypothetical protein